jgi:hypothetical protein
MDTWAREWNAQKHRKILQALKKKKSAEDAARYVHALRAIGTRMRGHSTRYSRKNAEILETVELASRWHAKPDSTALGDLLVEGAHSAYERMDPQRAKQWLARARSFPRTARKDREADDFGDLPLDLVEVARLVTSARKPKRAGKFPTLGEDELSEILGQRFPSDGEGKGRYRGHPLVQSTPNVMLRSANEIWLRDTENKLWIYDCKRLRTPDFRFDPDSLHDTRYLAKHVCDERVSLWNTALKFILLERYGPNLAWHYGLLSQGHAVTETVWIAAKSPARAEGISRQIEQAYSGAFRRTSPWAIKGSGVIMRKYEAVMVERKKERVRKRIKGMFYWLGVYGRQWLCGLWNGLEVVREFPDEEEAIRAFEEQDLQRRRRGEIVEAIYVNHRLTNGRRLR